MSELTIKIQSIDILNKELEEYISSLKGVLVVKINSNANQIYIKYDSKLISIKQLVLEVKLFLYLINTPSIISFNKHSNQELVSTSIVIEDACCEYCIKGAIEELILLDGIEMANADFDYNTYFNISIEITYDKKIYNEDNIKDLVTKIFK